MKKYLGSDKDKRRLFRNTAECHCEKTFLGVFYAGLSVSPFLWENIFTVVPKWAFWEKATLLHHEADRSEYLEMPQR